MTHDDTGATVRVLHIDDERHLIDLTRSMLDRLGSFDVVGETDPTAAVDRLREVDPDCVLCDYQMPERTGLEVLNGVRDVDEDVPFLMYTGEGSEDVADEAMAAGATGYLKKGSGTDHFQVVAERIRTVVDAHRTNEQLREQTHRLDRLIADNPSPVVEGHIDHEERRFRVERSNPEFDRAFDTGRTPSLLRDAVADVFSGIPWTEYLDDLVAGETVSALLEPDGDPTRSYLLTGVPVGSEAGRTTAYLIFTELSEREARREQIAELNEVAARFRECDTREAVYDETISAAENVLRFDICVINHEEDGVLVPVASSIGLDHDGLGPIPVEEGLAGKTYRESAAIVVNDLTSHEEATPKDDYGGAISVPLGDWGVMQITTSGVNRFDGYDLELTRLLAAHAANAVSRLERERELQEYQETLAALHEYTREFMGAETVDKLASLAVEGASRIVDEAFVIVREYDEATGVLRPVAYNDRAERLADGDDPSSTFDPGEGLVGTAFETGEMVTSDGVAGDDRATDRAPESVSAAAIAPIGRHGTLTVGSIDRETFSERELDLCRTLAATLESMFDRLDRDRALREREAELSRQNTRLERFASFVSHDLRTPLTVVQGNLELLAADHDDGRIDTALQAVDRLEELTEDMLAYAREGEQVEDTTEVDLAAVVRQAWDGVATADATLTLEGVEGTVVEGRASRLRQAFENLFANAVEHGGESVTVRVRSTPEGFVVADDGPGIDPEDREEVFEPGFTTTRDGTGLGLGIVDEIAAAHDWSVEVKTSASGGAKFVFQTD